MKGFFSIRIRLFLLLMILLVVVLTVHSFVLLSLTRHQEVTGSTAAVTSEGTAGPVKELASGLREKYQQHWRFASVFIVVNALIFSVVLFFRLDRVFIRPLEKLSGLADKYQDHNLAGFGVQFYGKNPFHSLAHVLRQMLEQIRLDKRRLQEQVMELKQVNEELLVSRKQLVRSEKLATVGQLSAGLAHEIGNPLAIVQGYLELLQFDDLEAKEREQYSEISRIELERVGRLIRELLQFSRTDTPALETVVAGTFLQECLNLAAIHSAVRRCQVTLEMGERDRGRPLSTSPDHLRQIVLNLLLNAADSLFEQGEEEKNIIMAASFGEEAGSLTIRILDNGPGVAQEIEARLFEPFFTTKKSGEGTGLGLFVSQLLVERLGGDIFASNRADGKGFEVRIVLHQGADIA